MLKIHYGLRDGTITNIDSFFHNRFDINWMNDELVKAMILDVDKSKVISPYCIESPVLGQIAPDLLSSGVKALIIMYKTSRIVNASKCGDNCAKWIKKIAELKDLEIDLEHIMFFNDDKDNCFKAYFINNQKQLNSYFEYLRTIRSCQEERITHEREIWNSIMLS